MNIDFVGELECKKIFLLLPKINHILYGLILKTFGLVYFESMSQGTPLIFTKGQGIDGYFVGYIGYSVNPRSYDAKSKVELLLKV